MFHFRSITKPQWRTLPQQLYQTPAWSTRPAVYVWYMSCTGGWGCDTVLKYPLLWFQTLNKLLTCLYSNYTQYVSRGTCFYKGAFLMTDIITLYKCDLQPSLVRQLPHKNVRLQEAKYSNVQYDSFTEVKRVLLAGGKGRGEAKSWCGLIWFDCF